MRTASVAFLLALAAAAFLTPLVRDLAHRLGALDRGDSSRKIHKRPIPRLGGIAIVLAFYTPLIALLFTSSDVGKTFWAEPDDAIGLFAGGALIALLGVYDDLKGANARTKFVVQFAVAGMLYWLGYRIDELANPFGKPIALGWFGLPVTLLWIAGVINALNLIDGLDGLAGGVALVKVGITFVFAVLHGDPLMLLFSASLAGAILGFLWYNFNPATIFMGDTGSMFLGFVLAASAIQTHQKSATAVALLIPVVALGFPITDTLLAMGRRAARGAPLFQADREHIHHRLLARGLSQRQTVLILYAASAILGVIALALAYASSGVAAALLLGVAVAAFIALRHLGYMRFERTAEVLEERRRNLELRSSVRRIADRLRHASEVIHVWEGVRSAAPALRADCIGLRLIEEDEDGTSTSTHFSTEFGEANVPQFRTRHSLLGERAEAGHIELGWNDGRSSIDRDTEIAVELLCEHVLHALKRIEKNPEAQALTPVPGFSLAALEQEEQQLARVVNMRR
jgi:UDP-GlcNAc:undecaprenyl-phosphate GlcNAc-1-phosphate transferase